eukprot:scaffold12470_cov119-Isochrysis_galbana.AAC.1
MAGGSEHGEVLASLCRRVRTSVPPLSGCACFARARYAARSCSSVASGSTSRMLYGPPATWRRVGARPTGSGALQNQCESCTCPST